MMFRRGWMCWLFCLLVYVNLGYSQEEDFGLFVTDAGGNIILLTADLNVNRSFSLDVQVIGIAVDPHSTHDDHTIIFSTIEDSTNHIRKLHIEDMKASTLTSLTGHYVDRMAFEPISNNIYYTAVSHPVRGDSFVAVLSSENENKVLIQGLYEPRDIILHHTRRILYYTDYGDPNATEYKSHIGYLFLDGSGHGYLIDTDIYWPSGLTIDYSDDKLYWSDSQAYKIESYDLNTGERLIWKYFGDEVPVLPMDILIEGTYMYFVQYTRTSVTKLRLADAATEKEMIYNGTTRLDALAIYSEYTRQTFTGISGCYERDGLGDCSNICLPSAEPDSHICACADGHQLLEDGTTCENANLCPDILYGTIENGCRRYNRDTCGFSCDEGAFTELSVQTITCKNGIWNNAIAPCISKTDVYRLLVTDAQGYIYGLDTDGNLVQTFDITSKYSSNLAQVVGVGMSPHATSSDMNFVLSTIETEEYNGQTYQNYYIYRMNGTTQEKKEIYNLIFTISGGVYGAYADRFAIEPVTGNIYFTLVVVGLDFSSMICVLSPKGDFVPILGGPGGFLTSPRDIVLHPARKLLFWTDHSNQNPHIGYSNMDGSSAHYLLNPTNSELVWPNGLGLDTKNDVLYWSDGYLGKVESYNLITNERATLFTLSDSQLQDILIDGNMLYYLNWKNQGVVAKVNLDDVSDVTQVTVPGASRLDAMTLFSPNTYEIEGSTDCANREGRGNCSDVCLTNNAGQSCACPNGQHLFDDKPETCDGATLCDNQIQNGQLSETCLRHDMEECETVCSPGYSSVELSIKCENGVWNVTDNCKKDCNEHETLLNGQVTKTRGNLHGSEATFKCNVGFKISSQVNRKCSEGQWSNSNPVCNAIECSEPAAPLNGFVTTPGGKTFGMMAEYECATGYKLVGTPMRMCTLYGEWEGVMPTCQIVDCGLLQSSTDELIVSTPDGTTFGNYALYTCIPGYDLSEQNERRCGEDGAWEGETPTCQPKECPEIQAPEHGSVTFSDMYFYKSVASHACEEGYANEGQTSLQCQSNGEWNGTRPVCQPVECQEIQAPEHGSVTFSDMYFYKSVALHTCEDGYILEGQTSLDCQSNGEWNGTLPICLPVECQEIPAPEHGSVTFSDMLFYKSVASHTCEDGYNIEGQASLECRSNREWNGTLPICQPVECREIQAPEHGSVTYSDMFFYKSVASFTCEDGYTVEGQAIRECQSNSEWNGTSPICQPVECQEIQAPEHGSVTFSDGFFFKSVASHTCEDGYNIEGQASLECRSNREWNGTLPICQPVECREIQAPEHGSVTYSDMFFYKSVASFTCEDGYTVEGQAIRECQSNSEWNGTSPICQPVECREIQAPEHGSVTFSDGFFFKSVASHTCEDGYNIEGQANIECQSNREWNGTLPICQPVECQAIQAHAHGSVSFSDMFFYKSVASYTCEDGYSIEGQASLECQSNGEWNGTLPICQPVECQEIQAPEHGSVTYSDMFFYKSVASHTCEDGYTIEGQASLECQSNREWNGTLPTCQPVECQAIVAPEHGSLAFTDGFKFKSVATFDCDTGYALDGQQIVECLSNKNWSESLPTCLHIETSSTSTSTTSSKPTTTTPPTTTTTSPTTTTTPPTTTTTSPTTTTTSPTTTTTSTTTTTTSPTTTTTSPTTTTTSPTTTTTSPTTSTTSSTSSTTTATTTTASPLRASTASSSTTTLQTKTWPAQFGGAEGTGSLAKPCVVTMITLLLMIIVF